MKSLFLWRTHLIDEFCWITNADNASKYKGLLDNTYVGVMGGVQHTNTLKLNKAFPLNSSVGYVSEEIGQYSVSKFAGVAILLTIT